MQIFIFDLDDVLIHEGFYPPILCDNAKEVLELCIKKGRLTIASHNDHAYDILKILNIHYMFDIIQGFNDKNKLLHFQNIRKYFGVNFNDCILFDDLQENIDLGKQLGMKTKLINHLSGITLKDVSDIL